MGASCAWAAHDDSGSILSGAWPRNKECASIFEALAAAFPDAPVAALDRFARARPTDPAAAVAMYHEHARWRSAEGAPERLAAAFAAIPARWIDGHHRDGDSDGDADRDRVGVARDGTPLIVVQGARFDGAVSFEQYTLAICFVLERALALGEPGKVTVLLDVRAGAGWPNPPARALVPFFRHANRVLAAHYPEVHCVE